MARIRTLKPDFPQLETFGSISRDARYLFLLLKTQSDDEGRLRGSSKMLASVLFPYDNPETATLIDEWLSELEAVGEILRYKHGRESFIQILNWSEIERIDKPSKSKLPSPFDDCPELDCLEIREDSRGFARVRENSLRKGRERNRNNPEGIGECEGEGSTNSRHCGNPVPEDKALQRQEVGRGGSLESSSLFGEEAILSVVSGDVESALESFDPRLRDRVREFMLKSQGYQAAAGSRSLEAPASRWFSAPAGGQRKRAGG